MEEAFVFSMDCQVFIGVCYSTFAIIKSTVLMFQYDGSYPHLTFNWPYWRISRHKSFQESLFRASVGSCDSTNDMMYS